MEKQRLEWDTRRPNYAVYRRRRRIGLFVLLLVMLTLGGLGAYLFSGTPEETTSEPSEQADAPTVEQAPEETVDGGKAAKEEGAERAIPSPTDPTLYLTVPRLGLYNHTVRNDRSEAAMDLGVIKLPATGFSSPWVPTGRRASWSGLTGLARTRSQSFTTELP